MIVFKKGSTDVSLDKACKGRCTFVGHPDEGGTAFVQFHGSEAEAEALIREDPRFMEFAEPDELVYPIPEIDETDRSAGSWSLERIGVGSRPNAGAGVHIYLTDTGIRYSHSDFGGRAFPAVDVSSGSLKECNGDRSCAADVNGHGTHCAGIAAGSMFGVASEAKVYSVKTLSDEGPGQASWSVVGLDWVVTKGQRPSVVSMSLHSQGVWKKYGRVIDDVTEKGVVVVVAAGNDNKDSCENSPSYVPSAITVGATKNENSRNVRAGYSNFGTCNDIFAPGSNIKSASKSSDTKSVAMSGTSMACPAVAGAAALVLKAKPGSKAQDVMTKLAADAKRGTLELKDGDPDLFLWVGTGESKPTPKPETCRRRRRIICRRR